MGNGRKTTDNRLKMLSMDRMIVCFFWPLFPITLVGGAARYASTDIGLN